ncbi:alpha/beta hydrolase [Gorillibacterium timonense]|uniref:alpha/beta hydrolase n=1 Tax=Gorillibacterium timonense TaxID=1689269 RepID=UPI00071C323E|nr:alpha/beta hydrolase-fold protein [Gorillibacterium timonense]
MDSASYNKRTILKRQIASSHLQKERSLWVYLPPGYTELATYPVIYCQDGLEFLNFGRIATHTNYLVLEEGIVSPVIVGIEVDLPVRTEEYSPDGSRFTAYSRFVVEEVLPSIEREFPVQNEAEGRILAGDSLGATVSLHLALDYPELFHKILSLSGAFLQPTLQRLEQETDLSRLELYQLIGLQEEEVKTDRGTFDFLDCNRKAKKLLEERGADTAYVEADGKHLWGFWQNRLAEGIRHFLG